MESATFFTVALGTILLYFMERELHILELKLRIALTQTVITDDGHVAEIRKLVNRIDNIKIESYPNEHPPPHFHVSTSDFNVSLTIENCEIIEGSLNSTDYKKVKYFHSNNRDVLVKVWNELRPSNCPVEAIYL